MKILFEEKVDQYHLKTILLVDDIYEREIEREGEREREEKKKRKATLWLQLA